MHIFYPKRSDVAFEWDEVKRLSNLEKHHIDFLDAVTIFDDDVLTAPDERKAYAEQRYTAVGLMHGIAIVLVYTERGERIRVISARRANRHEREKYQTAVAAKKAREQ